MARWLRTGPLPSINDHMLGRVLRTSLASMVALLGLVFLAGPAAARCFLFCPATTTTTAPTLPPAPLLPPVTAPPVTVEVPVLPTDPGPPRLVPDGAARMLELINRERATADLGPLVAHAGATEVAERHSLAMLQGRSIWHSTTYFTSAVRSALGAKVLGENVAMNPSVENSHTRLMNSPGHRANILDARFNAVGIGIYTDGAGVHYITQDFLQATSLPKPAAAPAPPKPAAPPKPPRTPSSPVPVAPPATTPVPSPPTTTVAPTPTVVAAPSVVWPELRMRPAVAGPAAADRVGVPQGLALIVWVGAAGALLGASSRVQRARVSAGGTPWPRPRSRDRHRPRR